MGSTAIALVAAVVGVTGTLLAPVLAQRSGAKTQQAEFEHQQQAAHALWEREQRQAEFAMRRACYIETNAAFRHYRMQLMNYLWDVHRNGVTEADSERLEAARHAHHDAFAEAQMVASPAVLGQLDDASRALSEGYRRTKCLEEGNPDEGDTLEVIQEYLGWIWERWKETRAVMRADLGVPNSPM
ncbi:hypothetical protein AQJ46_47415 [Streptomyces canus]|uniref:Uncharacterized protein n=1 Tax=Streptomyces canus TaxID=58343 RepID=A0A101RKX6_9ACTN|nr:MULTISPECIES: hypothetical protein [Streptomyces]KUN57517.1 hypothetical protein AQJ46_47415 [Streptomyces canus]MDI5913382.1 hypothetical protein [Streptomyces sp. 12257]